MHEAIAKMAAKYQCRGLNDYINALREILQEIAMLGLWRSKFFEKAACYGGTALRILYGLDRFSEDIDFSLLEPSRDFDLAAYTAFVQKEMEGFGFGVHVEMEPFVKNPETLSIWSYEFFLDIAMKVKIVYEFTLRLLARFSTASPHLIFPK